MSEQQSEGSEKSEQSEALPDLDPEQFVGEPPAGDARPGDFVSDDQSGSRSTDDSDEDEKEDEE